MFIGILLFKINDVHSSRFCCTLFVRYVDVKCVKHPQPYANLREQVYTACESVYSDSGLQQT